MKLVTRFRWGFSSAFCAVFLLAAGALALPQGIITGDAVRIRSTPTTDTKDNILGAMNKGHAVVMMEFQENGPWIKVGTEIDGAQVEGWVHGDYVDALDAPPAAYIPLDELPAYADPPAEGELLEVLTNGLFADPVWGNDLLGHFPQGQRVYIICRDGMVRESETGEQYTEIDECNGFRIPLTRVTGVPEACTSILALVDTSTAPVLKQPHSAPSAVLDRLRSQAAAHCPDFGSFANQPNSSITAMQLGQGNLEVSILHCTIPAAYEGDWPGGAAVFSVAGTFVTCVEPYCEKPYLYFTVGDRLFIMRQYGLCGSGDYNKDVWEVTEKGLTPVFTSSYPGC